MASDADQADSDAWREMAERGEYVEIHGEPYRTVLDGRFTLAELEAIVARIKAANQARKAADHG